MLTAEELQRQKESFTPEIKARLAAMEDKRRADRQHEEARAVRLGKHPIPAGYVAVK